MTAVLFTRADDTESQGGSYGHSGGSALARPFCDPLAWPRCPMKSSSAWLTSSAWVQMIAWGPPAMRVERVLFSSTGSLLLVAW